ncbi:MAG: GNAT family N-acetyltransferase, partial [Streptococcaceae bacterium]|nr:GNAT family N-acetyltransferase [Streptococcaceae bacterium]
MKLEKTEENLQAIARLIEYAFNKSAGVEKSSTFLSRYQHAACFGEISDHQVTSLLVANDFTLRFYQTNLKMAGIGYVASFPEYRGDGGIKRLMSEMLADLYDSGYVVSNLAPFSERYYRQFGYENTIFRQVYTIPTESLQGVVSEKRGKVLRGTWQDEAIRAAVLGLYTQIINQATEKNSIVRQPWWWQRLDEYYPERFIAVSFDEANQPSGYLIYRMVGAEFLIDELRSTSVFGLRKLLTFIKSHIASFERFIYHAPLDDSLVWLFSERSAIEVREIPYMMSRIVNFRKLISALPLKCDGSYILEVSKDLFCPWN